MSFLAPTAGLLAAAIAGPILLALYFLKLRRRPLRVSSTLLWEQAVKDYQVNIPLRWLRPSLLFFLQLAALACFIIALARPVISGPAPAADRIVIVIDHSAAMSARDGIVPGWRQSTPAMRLDEAKLKAREFVRSLARSSGLSGARPMVQVISSAAQARIRSDFTADTREAEDQIESIEPTDQPGGAAAAIKLLAAAESARLTAEDSAGASAPEIVVFSDHTTRLALPARTVRTGPPPTPPSPPPGAAAGLDNAGIVTFSARRDPASPDVIRIFARLQSAAAAAKSVGVRLLADDELLATQRIDIPPAPADAPLTLEARHADACTLILAIDGEDLLPADNIAAAYIAAAASPAILIVSAETGGRPSPDPFLLGALESTRPRNLRTIGRDNYEAECAAARLENRRAWPLFDLVIFDRVEPETVPAQPSISFGAGLPLTGLKLAKPAEPSPPYSSSRFTSWRRAHPLLRYVGLDPVIFAPPPPAIDTPAASPAAELSQSVVPLAYGPTLSGPDAPIIAALEQTGVAATAGRAPNIRRVVVSFPLARSNWGPDTSFPVFISNAVDLLTGLGEAAAAQAWTTAEPITVTPVAGAREISVTSSVPTQPVLRLPVTSGSTLPSPVNLGVFPLAGVYRLGGAAEPVACINLLDADSTTLHASSGNAAAPSAAGAEPPRATDPMATRRGQREIWHWFVLAALALASAEWLIFARGMRG